MAPATSRVTTAPSSSAHAATGPGRCHQDKPNRRLETRDGGGPDRPRREVNGKASGGRVDTAAVRTPVLPSARRPGVPGGCRDLHLSVRTLLDADALLADLGAVAWLAATAAGRGRNWESHYRWTDWLPAKVKRCQGRNAGDDCEAPPADGLAVDWRAGRRRCAVPDPRRRRRLARSVDQCDDTSALTVQPAPAAGRAGTPEGRRLARPASFASYPGVIALRGRYSRPR
jgi:hypothetical protein